MKRFKVGFFCITTKIILLCVVLLAFGGSPIHSAKPPAPPPPSPQPPAPTAPAPVVDELDTAIRETSNYLNKQLTKGNKLVISNIQSDFPALSEYIIDELIANTVNDKTFSVVDRQQLNTIRAELKFQMSDEVDDATAQALGRMAGAQIIISGAISQIGNLYRLRIRALSVQSAQIEGQFNRNIPEGPTITALVKSQATGYGNTATLSNTSSSKTPSQQTATAQVITTTTTTTTTTTIPLPKTYNIGDKGPAGGIIFYDKGVFSNGWQYLESAPKDVGPTQWGAYGSDVSGTNTAAGTGKTNTQRIIPVLNQLGDDGAALLCSLLNMGGYNDWFLPSKDELNLMYENLKKKGLGGLGNGYYWSSSQNGNSSSYVQQFSDGYTTNDYKNKTYSIRAIRQF